VSLQLVRPEDVDLSKVDLEFAHIRRRRGRGTTIQYDAANRSTTVDARAALVRPPFCDDRLLWDRAVEAFYLLRSRGQAPGVPFIVVTNIYRQIGGNFR
jgi:hypothetical protein